MAASGSETTPAFSGAARAVFIAVLSAYLAAFGYLVWRTAVLQPYADMLAWLGRRYQYQADGDLAAYLLAPYNLHRLVWNFGVLDLDIRLFGAASWLFIAVGAASLLVTAALLAREAAAAAGPGLRLVGAGLAAMLVLMASNVIDASLPIHMTYPLATAFAVAAIVLGAARDPQAGITGGRIGALACLVAAGFANAAGLAVWPVLVVAAARERADWGWRLLVLLGGGAVVGLYAWGQHLPGGGSAGGGLQAALLFLNYLGLPWTRVVPPLGWVLGLGVLALAVASLALRGRPGAPRFERVANQLILFSLATAAMAALGRTDEGAPSDVPLRYTVFLTPLHVGLLMQGLPFAGRFWAARPGAASALAAAAAILLLGHQAAAGLFVVRTGDTIRREIEAFRAGQRTPEMTTMIYPDLAAAEALEARLRADGLYQRELHLGGAEGARR